MRNVSAIEYDEEFPKEFSRKSLVFVICGIVELPVDSKEEEVRDCIITVVKSCPDLKQIGPNDFEFINRFGHTFHVPNVATGFKFDVDALKVLVGQGDIYIRLVKDLEPPGPSDSRTAPLVLQSVARRPLVLQTVAQPCTPGPSVSRTATAGPSVSRTATPGPSVSRTATSGPSVSRTATPEPSVSHTSSPESRTDVIDLTPSSSSDSSTPTETNELKKVKISDKVGTERLIERFPNIYPNVCTMVMELCSGNFSLAANTFLDDVDALSWC